MSAESDLILEIVEETPVELNLVDETPITIELKETGAKGDDGVGVPSGGTTGQVLKKSSNSNYATEWADESGGDPPVNSVFGRTDDVVAQSGDYNEDQIAIEDPTVYEALTDGSVTGNTIKELIVSLITSFSVVISMILDFMNTKAFDKTVDDLDDITAGTTNKHFTDTEKTKLSGIESGAEVNNISDANATDLTDGGGTTLHHHDSRYYTETESDSLLAGKSNVGHTHDDRYYTETETDSLLAGKSNTGHNHDDRYYTESETDSLLGGKANTSHTHAISDVTSLQTSLDAKANLATAKGVVVHGATAGTSRPSGYASVEWIGSVEPTNATNDDTWVDTSS